MSIAEIIGVVGAGIACVILVGSAAALLRGSYNKAKIEDQRQEIADQDREIEKLKQDKVELAQELTDERALKTASEARESALQTKVEVLSELATQRAQTEAVMGLLEEHHTEAMDAWTTIAVKLQTLLEK
jgi:hypothetical protein